MSTTSPGDLRFDPVEGEWEACCYLHRSGGGNCNTRWSLPLWVGEDPEMAALYLTDRGWACYEGRWCGPEHADPRNVPGPEHGKCDRCNSPVVRELLDAEGVCGACRWLEAPPC